MNRQRRFGKPRTDEERRKRHKARFGTEKLPPRGTGLKKEMAGKGDHSTAKPL